MGQKEKQGRNGKGKERKKEERAAEGNVSDVEGGQGGVRARR